MVPFVPKKGIGPALIGVSKCFLWVGPTYKVCKMGS